MGTDRPKYVDDIFAVLEKEVTGMVKLIKGFTYEDYYGRKKLIGPNYKAMRIVLAVDDKGGYRICERKSKTDDEKELCLLRKAEFRAGGLSEKYRDVVVEKVASELERQGKLDKRKVYSTKEQATFKGL